MTERAQYQPEEERRIREEYQARRAATCPRCGVAMSAREIGGGSFGLGYSRQREWLICPQCKRSAIFDARRGTRT